MLRIVPRNKFPVVKICGNQSLVQGDAMDNHASVKISDNQFIQNDLHHLARDFCELPFAKSKREQALGFELFGKDREHMIDVQASELACAASMN